MVEVLELFKEIQEEMTSHMQKEEVILFPRIKLLESLFNVALYFLPRPGFTYAIVICGLKPS